MSAVLPKTSVEVRQIPDWPGYAIDRTGIVWRLVNGKWVKLSPRRTAAGANAVWLSLPSGIGTATRRVADLYKEVFNNTLPRVSGTKKIPRGDRPSGR